ncbi:hypothetical protein [Rhizobium sp.]
MGRLAGISIAAQARQTWQQRVRQRREDRAYWGEPLAPPLVHPPAGRRQLALLWHVAVNFSGQMRIGWRGDPPLTDDMRALLRKGHLVLRREARAEGSVAPPKSNWLIVTDAGATAVARARIGDADKHYIELAMKTGAVR